jgi:hypothetical protein
MTNAVTSTTIARPPQKTSWLKWLRRCHAWIGLWGAALGLLFGATGILLNHRSIMKIPAAHMEQTQIELALPTPLPADTKALAHWLQTQLNIGKEASRISTEPAKNVIWAGQSFQQPGQWRVDFHSPQHSVNAEYWVGNTFVSVKQQDANAFAFLTRLHKGVGLGAGWILLADSLAGGLVFLSLTGLLLWTKLHGPRLVMAGLATTSLTLAIVIVMTSL